jgi:hypothetical protein
MTVKFVPFERHQANHICTYYLSNLCVCRGHRDMCNGTMKELDLLNIVKVTCETKLVSKKQTFGVAYSWPKEGCH